MKINKENKDLLITIKEIIKNKKFKWKFNI